MNQVKLNSYRFNHLIKRCYLDNKITMFKPEKEVGLLGVPCEKGQSLPGTSGGPQLMRMKNIINEIEKYGLKVHDFGNTNTFEIANDRNIFSAKYPKSFYTNALTISNKIEEIIRNNFIALSIGGDHSLGAGTILGHSKVHENISVLWVDSHADINTPLSSSTGNMHGMPLSFLIREMQNEMPWIEEFKEFPPVVSAKHVGYIGLRDVDPYERFVLNKYNIKSFSMEDVDKYGINYVVQEIIKSINPNLDRFFHLSFDVDALDPIYAPSTGTAVPGGLSLREGIYICEQLYNTGKLRAIDIAEINTQLGTYTDVNTTLNSAIKLILGSLGIKREGVPIIKPDFYAWQKLSSTRGEVFSKLKK